MKCMCKDCNNKTILTLISKPRGYFTNFDMTKLHISICEEHAKELKAEWFENINNLEQDQYIKDFVDKYEIELEDDERDLFENVI